MVKRRKMMFKKFKWMRNPFCMSRRSTKISMLLGQHLSHSLKMFGMIQISSLHLLLTWIFLMMKAMITSKIAILSKTTISNILGGQLSHKAFFKVMEHSRISKCFHHPHKKKTDLILALTINRQMISNRILTMMELTIWKKSLSMIHHNNNNVFHQHSRTNFLVTLITTRISNPHPVITWTCLKSKPILIWWARNQWLGERCSKSWVRYRKQSSKQLTKQTTCSRIVISSSSDFIRTESIRAVTAT